MTCWQWREKALSDNLDKEALNVEAVSGHRPDTGENEPDSRNSSVSVQRAHQMGMSVLAKNFSSVCCPLLISSQVVSAHKWIRFNRLKIFPRSSVRHKPFCPPAYTPKILHRASPELARESPPLPLTYTCQANKRLCDSFQS